MTVPSSLAGLLFFVALLWPGFTYSVIRERSQPERQLSPWRETVTVVSVSLAALTLVSLLFALLRVLIPAQTPAFGSLIHHPAGYFSRHYVSVIWWAAILLFVAVAGSATVALLRSSAWISKLPGGQVLAPQAPHPSQMSSWWLAFSEYPPSKYDTYVGCSLDDGSYISGVVFSYNRSASDGPDRDLVLMAPIAVRPPGATDAVTLDGVGLTTVSARHLVTMTVSYVPKPDPAPAPADGTAQ